jgi:hypothetical protein
MGLLQNVYQFAKHASFAPDADGSGRNTLPTSDQLIDIGLIEGFEHDWSKGQDLEIWRPSPGHLELYESREIKNSLTMKWTGGELGPLAIQTFYRAKEDTSGTGVVQFTPGSSQLKKGWLFIELWDADTDTLMITLFLYGRIKIAGGWKSEETSIVKPMWEFLKLYSALSNAQLLG